MSQPSKAPSNFQVFTFMVILCVVCAVVLSSLASALRPAQDRAEELDRSKQMLMAAKIYHNDGYFLLPAADGTGYVPAQYNASTKQLEESSAPVPADAGDILAVYQARIHPYIVNSAGKMFTFAEAQLDEKSYLEENAKDGYYELEYKLLYMILKNGAKNQGVDTPVTDRAGYVIPVNGFGLWDRIYGYLALDTNATTVKGISWYWQKETAGLGAEIANPSWQSQFPGKVIFEPNSQGKLNLDTAPMGIKVVRGRAADLYGERPQLRSAVDGISGATLTGNGVTKAYKDSLTPYRLFLEQAHASI